MRSLLGLSVLLIVSSMAFGANCGRRTRCDCDNSESVERDAQIKRKIAHPLVEAFHPRGLRVSIPDLPGVELFAFHGKINAPMLHLEAGDMSKDILKSENGRWVFEDKNLRLMIGDVVNYWIQVQVNGRGHRVDNLSHIIKGYATSDDTIPDEQDPSSTTTTKTPSTSRPHNPRRTTTISSTLAASSPLPTENVLAAEVPDASQTSELSSYAAPLTATNSNCSPCVCDNEETGIKLGYTLSQLGDSNRRVEILQKEVDRLRELIGEMEKDMKIGTKLLLVGQQPPHGNAMEAIRKLITEKLELSELEEKIAHAVRVENGIEFEMISSMDKKKILLAANKKLVSTNYRIIDPEDRETLVSGSGILDERILMGDKQPLYRRLG